MTPVAVSAVAKPSRRARDPLLSNESASVSALTKMLAAGPKSTSHSWTTRVPRPSDVRRNHRRLRDDRRCLERHDLGRRRHLGGAAHHSDLLIGLELVTDPERAIIDTPQRLHLAAACQGSIPPERHD